MLWNTTCKNGSEHAIFFCIVVVFLPAVTKPSPGTSNFCPHNHSKTSTLRHEHLIEGLHSVKASLINFWLNHLAEKLEIILI